MTDGFTQLTQGLNSLFFLSFGIPMMSYAMMIPYAASPQYATDKSVNCRPELVPSIGNWRDDMSVNNMQLNQFKYTASVTGFILTLLGVGSLIHFCLMFKK